MNFYTEKLLNFADVVITRNAESQSAELYMSSNGLCVFEPSP